MNTDMTDDPLEADVIRVSQGLCQYRLFCTLNLSSYLRDRGDLALRQFARAAAAEKDLNLLVERTHERFQTAPLWLEDKPTLNKARDLSDGSYELTYGWDFGGDTILWECSPSPIDDVLPDNCVYSDWFMSPGCTMKRPWGEVFRNQLILLSSAELEASLLDEIRGFVEWQGVIAKRANKQLEAELYMLAQSYETMDRRGFEAWGVGA